MVPRRASFSFFRKVRCTMNWSVHQYQNPIMAEPISAPNQREVRVVITAYKFCHCVAIIVHCDCTADFIISSQPPNSLKPSTGLSVNLTARWGLQDGGYKNRLHSSEDCVERSQYNQTDGGNPKKSIPKVLLYRILVGIPILLHKPSRQLLSVHS